MVQASAQVELGLLPPDIGKRAKPHRQTARESGSYSIYDPPVRGSNPREAECWEPGGCVWFTCHWRRTMVSKPSPQEHVYGSIGRKSSDSHAVGSLATQLSCSKWGRSVATRDHTCGMNPGRDIEHGEVGSPPFVMHGQSIVSRLDRPGNGSLRRAWSIAAARSSTANVLPSPPYS